MTKFYGNKLSKLEIKTAGLSHDKSTILLCVGARKRKSMISLNIIAGQNILNIRVENRGYRENEWYTENEKYAQNEKRYKQLLKLLREQHVVPIRVPSILISTYSHENLHGLKLSCDSFQLIDEKKADKKGKPKQKYPFDCSMDDMTDDTADEILIDFV